MKNFPMIDMHAIARQAMTRYGFEPYFPVRVLEEVQSLKDLGASGAFSSKEENARDLGSFLWSSIDNAESMDLDQLEYCERLPNSEIRIMVAIADVDEYVAKGSFCDRHASHNGTSVYTGVETFPMLPQRLSWDLSSLKQDEERLAVVIDFFVLPDGSIRFNDVYRAVVLNKAKLVYESVGDWLEGKGPIPEQVKTIEGLEEQLRLQEEASKRLHKFRTDNGALELETIEASPVVKENEVVDLVVKKKNQARMIIENFMIAANGTMVWFLGKKGSPMIQRIVRTPERWMKITQIASSLGESLPPEPDPRALSDFLSKRQSVDPDHFPDLSLTIVKLLGPGEYVLAEGSKSTPGHFGLAVADYTHSTAPNRRYVDLVIQRLLKAVLSKEKTPYAKIELNSLAQWCTERDKASKKVERFMRKVAACVLLRNRVGEVFSAIVTGASEKGTYARLLSPPVEGRIVQGEKGMEVGQKVRVRLVRLEPEKGFIDFERGE